MVRHDDMLRRRFLIRLAACAGALTAAQGQAQAARLDEKSPQAVALGYVHDTTKADATKYPKHANSQKCSGCALYQGKPGDAWGGCPLFSAKQVHADGWCSAWAKKA